MDLVVAKLFQTGRNILTVVSEAIYIPLVPHETITLNEPNPPIKSNIEKIIEAFHRNYKKDKQKIDSNSTESCD